MLAAEAKKAEIGSDDILLIIIIIIIIIILILLLFNTAGSIIPWG